MGKMRGNGWGDKETWKLKIMGVLPIKVTGVVVMLDRAKKSKNILGFVGCMNHKGDLILDFFHHLMSFISCTH